MMAAGTALEYGASVTIFEHTDRLGKKLAITGKGRCNVTNASPIQEIMNNIPRNPRFLFSALNSFTPEDTMDLFARLGVELKVERGRRVFPESDKAIDIVNAMKLQDALSHFLDPVFEYGLWESVEHTVELRFGMGMRCFREPNTIHVMTDAQKAVVAERMQYLDNVVAEVVADINK